MDKTSLIGTLIPDAKALTQQLEGAWALGKSGKPNSYSLKEALKTSIHLLRTIEELTK